MVTFEQVELYYRAAFLKATNPDSYAEYYEGSYHRPHWKPGGAIAPQLAASYRTSSLANVTPRKGREYTEMELPQDYTRFDALATTQSMPKFICITMKPGSYPFYIYGWIDSVEPIATKGPRQNTLIRWHVDYWLTISAYNYLRNANPAQYGQRYAVTFANGRVKRGPASMARPDPSEPRRWVFDSSQSLGPSDKTKPWIVVLCTITETVLGISRTTIACLFWQADGTVIKNGVNYIAMPLTAVYAGWIEELLALDPDSVIGVYLCPFQPYAIPTVNDWIIVNNAYGAYRASPSAPLVQTILSMNDPVQTDDGGKYIVTDPTGAALATVPWGQPFTAIDAVCDASPLGCNLIMELRNGSPSGHEYAEGMILSIPLQSVSVTSNSYSSYVYSGERDYDISMRRIQQQQNAVSGVLGSGETALGGALAGGMSGAAGGPVGIAGGAGIGLGLGLAKAGINYLVQGYYDDKTQTALDRLKSNQAANVIITGGGGAWLKGLNPGVWNLVHLVRDSESAAELTGEQTELGYVTDAFTTNAGTLIAAGGPLRIEGLQVDGDITPAGRANIQALFARGVHLDLIQ